MTSYRGMRRQARRARRTGMQPMMVFNSGDQLPETAGLIILRLAWRYRSELAPLYLAATVLGVSWSLHTAYRHSWALVLGATVVGSAVLAAFGARLGLPTLTERLYAAMATLTVGGWITAATIRGPFASLLPQAMAIGGLALSVPWWAHRRRRAKVRVERKLVR